MQNNVIYINNISSAHRPQLNIGAFAHMQSNGVVDGTKDWETPETEGPPVKDHI